MLSATFEYVLNFTVAHEGDTPFMYNNWPIKNKNRDVTVGVGHALFSEHEAASAEIRKLFTVKATGLPASDSDMRAEFRRVYNLQRTATNLWTDFRDKSPLKMDRGGMLSLLRQRMLMFWDQRGVIFLDFDEIPAQGQVALMSWNYGARLRNAPKMCAAVKDEDYDEAARQSNVPGWDSQKNAAHKRLFFNAAEILEEELDFDSLPPMNGPFKPPPNI
jgi:hypothetical protein